MTDIGHNSISMLDFKLHLYKLNIYHKVKKLVDDSDFLITLAWNYQQYISKDSFIYNYIKQAIPNRKLNLDNIMHNPTLIDPTDKSVIFAAQFKIMLYQYGMYDDINDYLNSINDVTQIIWNNSPTYSLNSDIVKVITERLTWPDGKPFTDEDMQELFEGASNIVL